MSAIIAQRDRHILPLDVITAIIGEIVHSKDVDTLRSCSLLSHDVLPHCRIHLFRTFDMRDATRGRFDKFNALLSNSPHLVPYVRIVHLLDRHFSRGTDERSFMANNPSLPSFLHLLTNVETFGLHFGVWRHWYDLERGIQSGIKQIVKRPCFMELHLENVWSVTPSLLNSCRSLKVLSATGSFLKGFRDRKTPVPEGQFIYLDSATFTTSNRFIRDLYPCSKGSPLLLRLSRLRHLTISLSPEAYEASWKLIHCASETLQRLTINQTPELENAIADLEDTESIDSPRTVYANAPFTSGGYSQNLQAPYVTLSPLFHLQQFSFTVMIDVENRHSVREHLHDWCLLLRTSPPSIREINIKLDLFFSEPEDIFNLFDPSIEWTQTSVFFEDLDDILSNPVLLPVLANVEIVILLADDYAYSTDSEYSVSCSDGSPWPPLMQTDEIEDSVLSKMPLTNKRLDGLRIDVRTGHHY